MLMASPTDITLADLSVARWLMQLTGASPDAVKNDGTRAITGESDHTKPRGRLYVHKREELRMRMTESPIYASIGLAERLMRLPRDLSKEDN
jgi:hypothetical protein